MKRLPHCLSIIVGLSMVFALLDHAPLAAAQQTVGGNNNLGQFRVFTLYGGVIVINDGAVALDFDTTSYTDTVSGFTVSSPLRTAQVIYLVGDRQPVFLQ